MSRSPASDICSVRGIGVADIAITSTFSFSWRRSSFCLTPKRCSSSTIKQAEVLRAHVAREHPVGADQDVHAPLGEALDRRFLLGRRAEARDVLERERVVGQALGERPVVLLGEDRRRHQHQHLLALVGRLERRPQRDLGLAVADVAADQPVHRPRRLHVGLDQLDRLALVGRLGEREALLELALPVGVGPERVPAAALRSAYRLKQLARQLLRRAPGARLHRLPAGAAELAQRRVLAAGADVARDLRELVGGHEHAVVALVFEVQVVARDVRHGARLKAREAGHAVVLVHHDVARAQLGERAQRPLRAPARRTAPRPPGRSARRRRSRRCSGNTASFSCGRDEALAQRRRREAQRGLEHLAADVHLLAQPGGFQAPEVVGRPLALAAPRETPPPSGSPSARASRAPARPPPASAPPCPPTGRAARSPGRRPAPTARSARARASASWMLSGLTYRWWASSSPNAAQTSLQWSLSTGASSSSAATTSSASRADQVEQRAEALDRQQLGDVRPARRSSPSPPPKAPVAAAISASSRCSAASSAAGRDLDLLDLAERALREGREPAQRFDLHVEHVHPHGALLGRREHVQQAAPHRELPALLDLVDALIARRHELGGALVEVEQLAHPQRERVRAQLRVGDLLRQRHRADHHDRLLDPGRRLAPAPSSASSAATRRPTRCGGGARWDS